MKIEEYKKILTKYRKTSPLERRFINLIIENKLPIPETEYKFDKTRRWRFDFAYPKIKLAIELEGGIWSRGRHTRGIGYIKDCEKYNAAVLQGWKVLRYTSDTAPMAMDDIRKIIDESFRGK
jgi:very-short-patch-repair endonuclease